MVWSIFSKVLGPDAATVRGGLPSSATVRGSQRTSMRVTGQPVFKVDLDVAVPGRGSVPVSVRRVVPPEHLAAVAVGATLPAVVDPQKALAKGAPELHGSAPGNQAFHWTVSGGDAAAAFGAVLYTVVTGDNIVTALTGIVERALNTAV